MNNSYDEGAPRDAIVEAFHRTQWDGIPRHVYADGRIMKYNWEMPSKGVEILEGDALEEHIAQLLEEHGGNSEV